MTLYEIAAKLLVPAEEMAVKIFNVQRYAYKQKTVLSICQEFEYQARAFHLKGMNYCFCPLETQFKHEILRF